MKKSTVAIEAKQSGSRGRLIFFFQMDDTLLLTRVVI